MIVAVVEPLTLNWKSSPEPVSETISGSPKDAPLPCTMSVACRLPITLGVKTTPIWQLAPGARLSEQVLEAIEKSTPTILGARLEMALEPGLLTVTICGGVAMPRA